MSETLKLLVRLLHLVVLRVEQNRLLDLHDIALVENVLANAELFNAEVGLQSVSDGISTSFIDAAVEDFEKDEGHVALDELGDGEGTDFTQLRVTELERMEHLIRVLQDIAESFRAVSVKIAVSDVEVLNLGVRLEDGHQDHEIMAPDIILTDVKFHDTICILESQSEVLKTKTIVKELVKCGLLQLVLIL